jgi:uncharacterized protein with FMN-binding domain
MPTIRSRTALLPLLGLTVVGGLAACAAPAATTPDTVETTDTTVTTPETTAPDTSGSDTSGFADGTYTADGGYVAPSGPETVTVTVTLADGVVTAVEVVGHASDPQAKSHQADFAGGIAAEVVGKSIEGLSVDRVAGSSLTGAGFNTALDEIRSEATA